MIVLRGTETWKNGGVFIYKLGGVPKSTRQGKRAPMTSPRQGSCMNPEAERPCSDPETIEH